MGKVYPDKTSFSWYLPSMQPTRIPRDIKGRSPMPHHTPTLNKIFGPKIANLPALGFRFQGCVGFHTPPGSKSKSWQKGNRVTNDVNVPYSMKYESIYSKGGFFLVLLNPLVLSHADLCKKCGRV